MWRFSLLLCIFCCLISKGFLCKVGSDYDDNQLQYNSIGRKWFLNVVVPAPCSGSVGRYKIRYYDNNLEDRYDVTVAIWKVEAVNGDTTTYIIDSNSIATKEYNLDKRRKRGTETKNINLPSNLGVRKGSIFGVYLGVNRDPFPIIGRPKSSPDDHPSDPFGACVMVGGDLSTTHINCTTTESNIIVQAEGDIAIIDCGTPPVHPNTNNTLVDGDTEFGARVEYNCNIGYNATSGNNLITCQLNGNWSDPTLTCQLVDCGTPGSPPNGLLVGNVFTYNASVQISCNAGHNLIGNDTLSCQANGQWNDTLPICAPVNCGDPGTLTNGMIGGSAYTYSSVITFSCNTGYNLMGNISLFCQTNGQWNASIPVCSLINCGYPGNITNGVMMGANYTYSSIVTFTCNEGYILQGTNSLMCLINGWNDTLPSCSPVDCGDPGTQINVRSQGTNYTYQSIITFSCVNDDYTFVGNTAITCNADGHWNGSLPSCVYGECNDPGIPSNGQRIGSNFSYGASVSFSCNTGYELIGSNTLMCDVGNKWDYDPPVCNIIYCNAPGAPANGSISPMQANFTFNSTVQYQCNIGYEVIGHDTTTCGPNRTWTNGVPVCNMVVCPALTLPNGNIEGSNSYSSTITFHCNDSYQLSGNSSAVCQLDKTWSTDVPNCLKLCANDTLSSPLINGYQSPITGPYVEGDVVRYHCNAGYVLQGTPMVTCLATGHWSPIQEMLQCLLSTVSTTTSSTIMTSSITMTSSVMPTSSRSLSQSSSRTTSLTMSNTIQRSSSSLSITMLRSSSMIRSSIAPSNTSIPSDASSLALSGVIAGVVVAIIIILIVIVATVILIALLVSRSKRQKLVINKGSTETSVTNPMMHIDELYDSIPNRQPSVVTTRVHGTGDDTAIPTIIITKETLPNEASLSVPRITSSVSDYEVPIQTLTRAPPSTDYSPGSIYLQLENLEESDVLRGSSRSIYDELSQLPDDDKSTLRRDQVTTSIYDNSFDEDETLRRQLEDNYGNMDDDDNGSNNEDTLKRNKVYVEDEYDCIDVLDDLSLPPPINLDESSTAIGLTSEESAALQQDNGTPNAFYFSLEDPNEHQNEQKIETIEPVAEPVTQQKRTLKSTEKRKTKVFIQPAENEEEIYGQMETSSVTLISPKTLKFEGAIGSGQFGNVFKALWSKGGDRTIEVAVKTLQKNATEQEKIKFLQEAAIMAQFKHSNVIKLFGIVSHKDSPMIVIEYMPKGDLFGVLQKLRPDPGQLAHPDIRFNLLSFCRQVCLGMVYLSGKGFVHRDLAARNILVSADNICKIIDFGLSRDLEDENYYVSHKGAMIPVKWTAPEALNYRKYSTTSDVWSYGCLMYEIWSVGHKPYEKFSNIDTLERICSGYRLPPPPGCPIAIYKLMMDCWHPIGDDRPSFNDIMLVLLQQDKDIFFMPEDALSTHPKSGTLGASLDAGELMYADIQKTYEEEMDTIL